MKPITFAAICVALLLVGGASVADPALASDAENGPIAFDHIVFGGPEDVFTIKPDGTGTRQITSTPPTEGGSEAPSWSPSGDRIYFDSDRAGNVHAFSTNPNGQRVRQVTTGDGFEFTPTVSADGRLLAYEHETADFGVGGIYLASRQHGEFGNARQLTRSPLVSSGGFDTEPEFSPDGSKLAFLRILDTQRPNAMSAIFVIGTDGSGLTQLTAYDLNAAAPHWSPEATRLLFSSNSDNFSDTLSANLYTVDPDGSRLTQITHEADGMHAFTPDWSPDATQIVFAHADATAADLRVMSLSNGALRVIRRAADGTVDQDPDWAPAG